MSHAVKVCGRQSAPPSVETLIRASKARVLVASTKRFVVQPAIFGGLPQFSRELTRNDVIDKLVRQAS